MRPEHRRQVLGSSKRKIFSRVGSCCVKSFRLRMVRYRSSCRTALVRNSWNAPERRKLAQPAQPTDPARFSNSAVGFGFTAIAFHGRLTRRAALAYSCSSRLPLPRETGGIRRVTSADTRISFIRGTRSGGYGHRTSWQKRPRRLAILKLGP